jgi:uncharacterized protein (DUF58 family)
MHVKKLDLNLIPQIKSKELRAKRRVLSRTLEGGWTALLKGRGMEFAGFRVYQYGDDASRIDWGASLRSKDILVREFEEYRNVNVLFLVDVSNTMLFSSQRKLKAEFAAELAFNLALSVLDNGDSVGYALFADDLIAKELPGVGRGIVEGFASVLSDPRNYGGGKNFSKVITSLNTMLKQRALIIIISDFIGMPDGWERYVKMVAEKFDLIGIMVRDPRDRAFPETGSQFLLEDPFSGECAFVDVKDAKLLFERQVQEDEAHIKQVFDTARAGFVAVTTDAQDMFAPVLAYFRRRSGVVRG